MIDQFIRRCSVTALLLASAVGSALASPFSDFSARVAEIRQAQHLPQMQIVEDAAALTYLQYLRDRQEGHAISNGEWRVTRWAASAYDCRSGQELPTSAASRADALCAAEEQHGDWPRTGLFDRGAKKACLAILPTRNGWLIATPRQQGECDV